MSRQKAYCIIEKGGFVYFPIKTKSGPYRDETTGALLTGYLAGMPNFFGGTVGRNESIWSTLINEVKEESQEKIKINLNPADEKGEQQRKIEGVCVSLDSFNTEKTVRGRTLVTEYYFYRFDADNYQPGVTIADFGGSNRLVLSTAEDLEANTREMSCILKIPVNQLHKNFDNFLDKCIEIGGENLLDKEEIIVHSDWSDRGTQNAFKEFCRRYGTD